MFYIYLYHFGIIKFAFYPEKVVRGRSLKTFAFKNFTKNFTSRKNPLKNTCAGISFEVTLATSLKWRL